MCLMLVDSKPKRKFGIGYKVVVKQRAKFTCYDYIPKAGTVKYPLNQWLKDKNNVRIRLDSITSYLAGFHISLDKGKILECVERSGQKDVVAIKVRFRKVVATDLHEDGIYGKQVVAREVMNLGQIDGQH